MVCVVERDLLKAWERYLKGKFFKTTLEPFQVFYGMVQHPVSIKYWQKIFEEEGKKPVFRLVEKLEHGFGKNFFKQLKDCELNDYKPPMLQNFNSITNHKNAFHLKRNLGDTRKKFIRFEYHDSVYLSSNIFEPSALMDFTSTDHCPRFYTFHYTTPIPSFAVFLKIIKFSKRLN